MMLGLHLVLVMLHGRFTISTEQIVELVTLNTIFGVPMFIKGLSTLMRNSTGLEQSHGVRSHPTVSSTHCQAWFLRLLLFAASICVFAWIFLPMMIESAASHEESDFALVIFYIAVPYFEYLQKSAIENQVWLQGLGRGLIMRKC